MGMTPAQAVKELRDRTGLGMMECKRILEETGGDYEKAKELVAKRGQERAAKVGERAATEGIIYHYLHHDGKLGVMLELNCNTDFVAKSEDFKALAKEICLQIAALPPQTVRRDELDQKFVQEVREYQLTQVPANKPKEVIDKIVEGKMKTWFAERSLLDMPYVKDPAISIQQLIEKYVGITKENIVVTRFARYKVGETTKPEVAPSA